MHLEVGIVPERDGDRFVLRQPIGEVHTRRKDGPLGLGRARRRAGAPNDVVWRRDGSTGRASGGGKEEQSCGKQS